ncbi:actin-related protein 5 isoform X2 [Amborella trichopoda]|uniref:actin-related protein 5 isoform X2 n=1 Tax=Amborella trichopoda TaxID=13333 RepID=UPI0009BDB191|nr:actin-related protein 5 isoform X2 [Amborella trichopoda]|eukprot:XP_020524009.1 actin-related protein 5 isoform X2 [Amborella trichopoda]
MELSTVALGESVSIIGDLDPGLMKYFDYTRAPLRSPFDSNVVYQFETMEYILDYAFERIGVEGPKVDHPILITECVCNPVHSRSKMAELLFETYGIPSVAYGVDAAFSYKHNQKLGICDNDGLVVCSGFTTSHVIPILHGEPVFEASCRTNIGGYHVTDYMKQLLSLQYPYHVSSFAWEKVEHLKMEHCYIALDYASESQLFQKGAKETDEKVRYWQLPYRPPPVEEEPSEEELARKAAIKEKQGQRLREMAAAKRSSRITEFENELQGLEFLLQQLENVEDHEIPFFLSETGYVSKQEIESAVARVTQSLRKAKGEPVEVEEKTESPSSEKYPLINIPDHMLTPEQLKQKKRQIFIKTTSEGKLRAKQKKQEEELERERQNQQDEEKRLENPELYLEQLRAKQRELAQRVEQRKKLKTNGTRGNGTPVLSGNVGRGERLNAAQKERMRLLTTAAFDRGKGEDTFGIKDEDWQLYKLMSRDNDDNDEGPNEDEAELARVTAKLQEIDPTFVTLVEPSPPATGNGSETPHFRPLTAEDYRITLGIERFRCPEILFQPHIVGIDQAGLDEMVGISMRRLKPELLSHGENLCNSVLLTGGNCLFPGINERILTGIQKIRPFGSSIRVCRASDPLLDAWHGASMIAASPSFSEQVFSRQDYMEKGEEWLRKYQIRYTI